MSTLTASLRKRQGLDRLPDGWHSVALRPIGDDDTDVAHVVVGPGGVFSVDTKQNPGGKVWAAENVLLVNGHKTRCLENARCQATRVGEQLSAACGFTVRVSAVLVFVESEIIFKARPLGVHVSYREHLPRWIKSRQTCLSPTTVANIIEAARRDETWRTDTLG